MIYGKVFFIYLFSDRDEPLCVDAHGIFLSHLNPDEPDASVFSLSFTLVIFITSCMQEILLRANTFQLWSLTHSPARLFRDAKRGGVWGELGTEWMLCREKKNQSAGCI